ncbi:MAG: sodium ion-translocating decarboxylase subunit beta [Dehalococcoidia bacterium]|nr:sodium ion-translocating decarboxylase subunit beta [Dehalococcoidia bacterium]
MEWDSLKNLFEGFTGEGGLVEEPEILAMMAIGCVLLYLGIARKFEPLLLVGIGFGVLVANLPLQEIVSSGEGDEATGVLYYFRTYLIDTEIIPLLIFLGLGAMTDFEPLLNYPYTILLGAAAQVGVFIALMGAVAVGFDLTEAASIGIVGGADGPTTIYLATKLSPGILGAVAVAAYSYMALVPVIQPPIIRLLTTREQRRIRMPYAPRRASRPAKILFPVIVAIVVGILVPKAAPLIGMFAFGNLMRECLVVERLSATAQNALMNSVVIILGITVGSTMTAEVFLQWGTLKIFALGCVAFMAATAGGLILGQVMYFVSRKKVNPVIGAAGVSAVPMSARVVQREVQREDPDNFILMHAMGPNVAGVIGTAVAAGVLLALVPGMMD